MIEVPVPLIPQHIVNQLTPIIIVEILILLLTMIVIDIEHKYEFFINKKCMNRFARLFLDK